MNDTETMPRVEKDPDPEPEPARVELKAAEVLRLHVAQQEAVEAHAAADRVARAAEGLLRKVLESRGLEPRPGSGYRLELEGDQAFLLEVPGARG